MRRVKGLVLVAGVFLLSSCVKNIDTGMVGFDLMNACIASDLARISRLVKQGADINDTWQGVTPLMRASQDGNLAVVQHLLSLGADPKKSVSGATALNYATSNRRHDISILLLKRGADPNARPQVGLYDSPLATAIMASDKLLIEALIAAGATTNDPTALQA